MARAIKIAIKQATQPEIGKNHDAIRPCRTLRKSSELRRQIKHSVGARITSATTLPVVISLMATLPALPAQSFFSIQGELNTANDERYGLNVTIQASIFRDGIQ
jgi:predicted RecB family nuclease